MRLRQQVLRGRAEAVDLRDGEEAFGGLDVTQAISGIDGEISSALVGLDGMKQVDVDDTLISLDGTPDKARLGGNATVAVSMAVAHASAAAQGVPLWQYLGGTNAGPMPLPEIQIFGGGAHAARRVDVQDFMVIATGAEDFATALDWTAEVYRAAGQIMEEHGLLQGVADEGGYWPAFDTNEAALDNLVAAIERAGLVPGDQVSISSISPHQNSVRRGYTGWGSKSGNSTVTPLATCSSVGPNVIRSCPLKTLSARTMRRV